MRAVLGAFCVLMAGCGDDGVHHLPDAPPPPDARADAGPLQPVTLTITDGGVGQAGIRVYFQNPDMGLVLAPLTDAAGQATATVMPGAFVTVINAFPPAVPTGIATDELRTFAGVKPGDQLVLSRGGGSSTPVAVDVTVPIDPTATSYILYTSCGSFDVSGGGGSGSGSGGPGGPVLMFGCGATADVAIETRDASGHPLNSLFHPDALVSEGGTIDLSGDTYAPAATATYSYTSIPNGFTTLNVLDLLVTAKGPLVDSFVGADITANAASTSVKRAGVPAALAVTETAFFNGGRGDHRVLEWGQPGPYALSANVLLPEYMTTPEFDPAAHAARWTSGPGASQPDFTVLKMRFSRDVPSLQLWTWEIAAPYGGTSVTYPVLPAAAMGFNPVTSDSFSVDELRTLKVPGGYDVVRPRALTFGDEHELVAGGSGRLIYEALLFGGKGQRRAGPPPPVRRPQSRPE